MAKILKILKKNALILRKTAVDVIDINNPKIKKLIEDMLATLEHSQSLGLAAPQVGVSLKIFIIRSKKGIIYDDAPDTKPMIIINPKIISLSRETITQLEGCLSVEKKLAYVKRHKYVKAIFMDENGEPQEEVFEGYLAKVFQHEYEHLYGILFTDRIKPEDYITEDDLKKIIEEKNKNNRP